MMPCTKQESWWVLRAQSGDRAALNELFKVVQGPLYRYIVSLVDDRTLAEDVLQESFVRIYRKLGWLRNPRMFRPWCYRIASREAFRRIKRERRWREQSRHQDLLEVVPAPPESETIPPELLERLPSLVSQLSAASSAVLVLHYEEGMTLDDVAAVLEIPPGTARSRLAYGLAALRRLVRNSDLEKPA